MKNSVKYIEVKEKFNKRVNEHVPTKDIERELINMISNDQHNSLKYKKAFFSVIKDIDLVIAIKYGEEILKEEQDPKFMRVLAVRYKRIGNNLKANALMNRQIPMINFKNMLDEFINEKVPFDVIENYVSLFIMKYPRLTLSINKVTFGKLKDAYTNESIKYGEEVIKEEQDPKFMKVLSARYRKIGDFNKYEILKQA